MSASKKVLEVIKELEKMGHELVVPRNLEKYAFGIWDIEKLHIVANTDTEILLMEVPMKI